MAPINVLILLVACFGTGIFFGTLLGSYTRPRVSEKLGKKENPESNMLLECKLERQQFVYANECDYFRKMTANVRKKVEESISVMVDQLQQLDDMSERMKERFKKYSQKDKP